MGTDIHVRATQYNDKTNFYEEIVLYRKGEEYHYNDKGEKIIDNPDFCKVPIYDNRHYEMFDGMKHGDEKDGYGVFPWTSIKYGCFTPELAEELKEKEKTFGYFDFYTISLAEMALYLKEHPFVIDYDSEDWEENKPKPFKTNPIQSLFDDICSYISFASDNWDFIPLSEYKIIFYFDN